MNNRIDCWTGNIGKDTWPSRLHMPLVTTPFRWMHTPNSSEKQEIVMNMETQQLAKVWRIRDRRKLSPRGNVNTHHPTRPPPRLRHHCTREAAVGYTTPPLATELWVTVNYWGKERQLKECSPGWVGHTPVENSTPKNIWGAQVGPEGLKENRTQSWMSREGRGGSGRAGEGVNIIKHRLMLWEN